MVKNQYNSSCKRKTKVLRREVKGYGNKIKNI